MPPIWWRVAVLDGEMMATAKSVVTVGRFIHGGWEPLISHIEEGGGLPFSMKWRNKCRGDHMKEIDVVLIMWALQRLDSL